MSSFGGIWRDGAVVDPSDDCFDGGGQLVVLGKKSGELSLVQRRSGTMGDAAVKGWLTQFFWLDVRTPKVLAPKEAFDLLKIFRPGLVRIRKGKGKDGYLHVGIEDVIGNLDTTPIDWGKENAYAPPKEELPHSWIPLTPENYQKYIHCRCRFMNTCEMGKYTEGALIGISAARPWWVFEGKDEYGSRTTMYSPMQNGAVVLESDAKAKDAEEIAKQGEFLHQIFKRRAFGPNPVRDQLQKKFNEFASSLGQKQ